MLKSFILGLGISLFAGCSDSPPNDAAMAGLFVKHHGTFLELRAHLCAHPEKFIVMMDPKWAEPKISEQEKARLYALFTQLGVRGVYYDGACSFRLPVWGDGFAGGGN